MNFERFKRWDARRLVGSSSCSLVRANVHELAHLRNALLFGRHLHLSNSAVIPPSGRTNAVQGCVLRDQFSQGALPLGSRVRRSQSTVVSPPVPCSRPYVRTGRPLLHPHPSAPAGARGGLHAANHGRAEGQAPWRAGCRRAADHCRGGIQSPGAGSGEARARGGGMPCSSCVSDVLRVLRGRERRLMMYSGGGMAVKEVLGLVLMRLSLLSLSVPCLFVHMPL